MNHYRFHIPALPHTKTNRDYMHCAYSQKILKFCQMMTSLGHEVFHYGAEGSQIDGEHITVITDKEQQFYFGPHKPQELYNCDWTGTAPYWPLINLRTVTEIKKRMQPTDFLCITMGLLQKPISDRLPLLAVETGIGYTGTYCKNRAFESYAIMHQIWGVEGGYNPDGKFYDAVIPNYFDLNDFQYQPNKEDYFLCVGRLIKRKGFTIAADVCRVLGARLLIAGQGAKSIEGKRIICSDNTVLDDVEYLGAVGPAQRAELMGKAKALFAPTIYIGPFEGVNVEAQLCGTPVISTDWGCFAETIEQGKTGFRCRSFQDFVKAAQNVGSLDTQYIRDRAVSKYSMDVVKYEFQRYFDQLYDLHGDGWPTLHEPIVIN